MRGNSPQNPQNPQSLRCASKLSTRPQLCEMSNPHLLVHIAVALGVQADEGVTLRKVEIVQQAVRPNFLQNRARPELPASPVRTHLESTKHLTLRQQRVTEALLCSR